MPLVSIIIPTLNRAHLVTRAIKSVLAQTYQNFEIIIVDDGSTDTTEIVIKRFRDNRIKYIKHQQTRGPGAARNTGINISIGDYISFLDSDDEWQSTKIDAQIEIFENRDLNTGLVYTGVEIINRDKRVIEKIVPIYKGYVFDKILSKNFIVGSSTIMIKRKVLAKVGKFDECLPSCEDWDLWIRIAQYYEFYFVPELLVKHYSHSKRISAQFGTVLLGLKMFSNKNEMKIDKLRNNVKAQHYFHLGNHFCYYGDKAFAKKYLMRAFCIYPLNPIYFFSLIFILLFGRDAYASLSTSTRSVRHKLHYIILKK